MLAVDDPAILDDQSNLARPLQHGDVGNRVAVPDDDGVYDHVVRALRPHRAVVATDLDNPVTLDGNAGIHDRVAA
jgi:hypothetical protein